MSLFLFYLLVIFFFFKTILIFKAWKRDFKIFQVPSRTIWTLSHKWSNHINLKGRGNPLQSIKINTDWFITKIVHRNGECLLWIHTSVSWHALMCYKSNGKKMSLSKNMSLSQKLNLMTKVNVCIRQQSTHFTMVTVHHTDCIIIFMQDYTNSWFQSSPPPSTFLSVFIFLYRSLPAKHLTLVQFIFSMLQQIWLSQSLQEKCVFWIQLQFPPCSVFCWLAALVPFPPENKMILLQKVHRFRKCRPNTN